MGRGLEAARIRFGLLEGMLYLVHCFLVPGCAERGYRCSLATLIYGLSKSLVILRSLAVFSTHPRRILVKLFQDQDDVAAAIAISVCVRITYTCAG